jgi:cyclophilin family peptidyl-prolyl cis-trans isomerase
MKRLSYLLIAAMLFANLSFAGDKTTENKTTKEEDKKDKITYKKRQADNPEIAIETDFGTMKLELFRDVAPIHVDSMLSRIREKFYDGLIFHRIIDGFMIQGGRAGKSKYTLPAEFSKVKHIEGSLSMARRGGNVNSASTQFFICLAAKSYLDGQYTLFGHLMEGYDVLHKIGSVKTGQRDKPSKDVYMRKVYILKDVKKKELK